MKYSEDRKSKESITTVSEILCEWDPIDLMRDPEWPRDEYDNYILAITLQLDKNRDENELANLLKAIANDYMCQSTNNDENLLIAKKLIKHWHSYAIN
jgi:hypothetical protein